MMAPSHSRLYTVGLPLDMLWKMLCTFIIFSQSKKLLCSEHIRFCIAYEHLLQIYVLVDLFDCLSLLGNKVHHCRQFVCVKKTLGVFCSYIARFFFKLELNLRV